MGLISNWSMTCCIYSYANNQHFKDKPPGKMVLIGLDLTLSTEMYLAPLGDHKLIHVGLKQKAAVSWILWHSKGVWPSPLPQHETWVRRGSSGLSAMVGRKENARGSPLHSSDQAHSKATDPTFSPVSLFILGVLRTKIMDKIADNF